MNKKCSKVLLVSCLAVVFMVLVGYGHEAGPRQRTANAVPAPTATEHAVLDQYCVMCHNDTAKRGGLSLQSADLTHVGHNPELWEKVVRKLRAGMMPPAGARRPDGATYETLTVWLENELDRAAAAKPNVGLKLAHRLNRTEYANVIRDLLALEFDPSVLPVDDASYGFDNMAATLGLSPALLEAYVSSAAKISRMALGNVTATTQKLYGVTSDYSQMEQVDGLPFGTRGGLLIRHEFPATGEYSIRVNPIKGNTGSRYGTVLGEKVEVLLDGERVALFDFDTQNGKMEVRVPVKAGLHVVGATFLARTYTPDSDLNKKFLRSTIETLTIPGFNFVPHVGSVVVTGPFNPMPTVDSPSRHKIFSCHPANASGVGGPTPMKDEAACAREILTTLARRAFRRPANSEDLETLTQFYESARAEGNFDHGIEIALRRILADPEFILRVETAPPNVAAGQAYRISDLELASRLSFFLWSSIPDDELIDLASKNRLHEPAKLEQQVKRMMTDARSERLVENFTGQWLQLRNLQSASPLVQSFPDFDDNLRQAMRKETELLFNSIVREDRNVVDLLTADYTFVNERLAKHYGIQGVYGPQFRRVSLNGSLEVRRGLLGQSSIMTVTALSNRTSPVARGKWVLMNILGAIPPQPPPNVPMLKETGKTSNGAAIVGGREPTMRQRMEEHRINPVCSGCHRIMDPIGFSLENFDPVGQWRTTDSGNPVDASGELVDGTKFSGPTGLRQALLNYSPQFVRTVTEKLMTYAMGRGAEYYDMPAVRSIVRDAARNNNRFSSLVMGVVKSAPFQMNTRAPENTARR